MMVSNEHYINQAISELLGQVQVGDIVAWSGQKIAMTLVNIVNEVGHCKCEGYRDEFISTSRLFDVNKVKDRAVELSVNDAMKGIFRNEN